jgi:UDP-N-acetylmuramoyl-tripeptide--D-alanyl-D-alanine ligase
MIAQMSLQDLMPFIPEARYIGPRSAADCQFAAICTDTRKLVPGDLFVALSGENFDGNTFVGQAHQGGAIAAVVSSAQEVAIPQLVVPDTTKALGWLGHINRQHSLATIVAVTGSQGKTTVKELTGAILKQEFEVFVTAGNFNNTIGAPLMLLQLNAGHQKAVIELGANGAGEIAWTASITNPHVVLINNAAETHLEGFGSLEGVVRAKGEIIDSGMDTHTVILNADDRNVEKWIQRAGPRKVRLFAVTGDARSVVATRADYSANNLRAGLNGSEFFLQTPQGSIDCFLPLPGRHNVANAVAAAALAMEAGASLAAVVAAMANVQSVKGRLYPVEGLNGASILDDSYNASPSSFSAAIDVLTDIAAHAQIASVVIMGDMAELGVSAERLHFETGVYAKSKGVTNFFATGALSQHAVAGFGAGAVHFKDKNALADHVLSLLSPGIVVLIKGSRSAGMEEVTQQLKAGGRL